MFLYQFYLGGSAPEANLEVHDMQFVIADSPEMAFPQLKARWFGDKNKIHIDGYREVNWADGYAISLADAPSELLHLFFINVGGYIAGELAEQHEFGLFVAENSEKAKQKALQVLLKGSFHQHKDNLKEVDDCVMFDAQTAPYLHFSRNPEGQEAPLSFQGYLPI